MKKQIEVKNCKIEYVFRKSRRARRMRLVVYCDGSVVVTTPSCLGESAAEKFIREKADWLLAKISYSKQFKNNSIMQNSHENYLKYKDSAREFAIGRIEYFNKLYGFKFNKISIKNQKTRWGSCSKKGNLNFDYKIVLLPQRASDYIVVHELCHLKELNHSSRFWDLVAQTIPDYLEIKKELRKNSLNLCSY